MRLVTPFSIETSLGTLMWMQDSLGLFYLGGEAARVPEEVIQRV